MNPTKNEATSDQYAAAYLKEGITQGIIYQVKILTWVAWKLLCKSDASMKNWYLGTEVRNALGFHDLVLKYEINNTSDEINNIAGIQPIYRFVQIKHKLCSKSNSKITLESLKSKDKKNQYSLIYLFKSFLNMLNKFEKIKMEQILDLIIFTNIDVDSIKFFVPVKDDPIFSFKGKGKRYHIDLNMIRDEPDVMTRLRQVMSNDAVIFDFLKKLVFAVDQPSESEMENWITQEMGKVFSAPQIFYNDLLKNMLNWFLIYSSVPHHSATAPYLTEERVMRYLFDALDTFLRAKQSEVYTQKVSSMPEQLSERLSKQLSQLHV